MARRRHQRDTDTQALASWAFALLRLPRTQQRIYLYLLAQHPLVVRRSGDVALIALRHGVSVRTVSRLLRTLDRTPELTRSLIIR